MQRVDLGDDSMPPSSWPVTPLTFKLVVSRQQSQVPNCSCHLEGMEGLGMILRDAIQGSLEWHWQGYATGRLGRVTNDVSKNCETW